MKNLLKVLLSFILFFTLTGCFDVEDVESIEFLQYPKTLYVLDEELEFFTVRITPSEGDPETLNSYDERLTITGFNTDTVGTRTLTVKVDGFSASLNFVYTVVNSLNDLLFSGGDGSVNNPYIIKNAQQLSNIRLGLDKHYKLDNDIDLRDVSWEPIGRVDVTIVGGSMTHTVIQGFTGSLDGNNKKIINYTSTENNALTLNPVSLFASINGTGPVAEPATQANIRNLVLEDVNMDVEWAATGLTNYAEDVHIYNVHVTGSFRGRSAATLVSRLEGNSVIENCTAEAEIIVPAVYAGFGGYRTYGGLITQISVASDKEILIKNCSFTGNVRHEAGLISDQQLTSFAGLIVGRIQGKGKVEIQNTTATGTIIGRKDNPTTSAMGFYGKVIDAEGNVSENEELHVYHNPDPTKQKQIEMGNLTAANRKLIGGIDIQTNDEFDIIVNGTSMVREVED